jgi:hypothetical protein
MSTKIVKRFKGVDSGILGRFASPDIPYLRNDVPSDVSSGVPSDVPSDVPSGVPSDVPSDMTPDVPCDGRSGPDPELNLDEDAAADVLIPRPFERESAIYKARTLF